MRKLDFAVGVPLGLVAVYALSLTSAFWVASQTPTDYIWALGLSAAIPCGLGIIVAQRAGIAIVAAGAMLAVVLIGFITGSDLYVWVAPLPLDLPSLFFHGARAPLVISSMVLIGTAGVVRIITDARRPASKVPTPTDDKQASRT